MDYPVSMTQAETLRSPQYIQMMRAQAKEVSQSVVLEGTPQSLWPLVSATDYLNQQVGMQQTHNAFLEREFGAPWMHVKTRNAGMLVTFEELPFEWREPEYHRVERIHHKGPLKYLSFGCELQAVNETQTRVTCTIRFVSRLPGSMARVIIQREVSKFIRVFEQKAELGDAALKLFFEPLAKKQTAIDKLVARWQPLVGAPEICQALADYVLRAPERLAYRVQPREIAATYGLDPLDTLKTCLRLTRHNQMHLMWDCRCPGCKGPKKSYSALSELGNMAYCESCAVNYGLAFDQNIELSFQPADTVRSLSETYFCAGSPANTPHIAWQQNLWPNQSFELVGPAKPGRYVLRSLACDNEIPVQVTPDGRSNCRLEINASLQLPELEAGMTLQLSPQARLEGFNHLGFSCNLLFEDTQWQSQGVTAADVQSVQDFHDLFPEQVLAPGESLPLQYQVLLLIQTNEKDVQAPELHEMAYNLITAHQGAVQQLEPHLTLGIFASAFEATSAAWDYRQELSQLNLMYESPSEVRLVLSEGPCEVYGDSERLSYRGVAVEELYTLLAHGVDGIVARERFFQLPELSCFLETPEAQWLRLPGSEGENCLSLRETEMELDW